MFYFSRVLLKHRAADVWHEHMALPVKAAGSSLKDGAIKLRRLGEHYQLNPKELDL